MIATVALVLLAQQSLLASPDSTGKALNQNQVTYFNDMAIIEVETVESSSQDRLVTGNFGSATKAVTIQTVRVLDANFENDGQIDLVFPCLFFNTGIARIGAMPHPDSIPLVPGRYFLAGRRESDGTVAFTPDVMSLGLRDASFEPAISLARIAAADGEVSVFSVFPTGVDTLVAHGREPKDVLTESLAAAFGIRGSLFSQADVLLRTNHRAFRDWQSASEPLVEQAKELAGASTGVERAVLLAVVYEGGDPLVEQDLFWELVRSDAAEPAFWDGIVGRRLLNGFWVNFRSTQSKYSAWQRNPDRQLMLASLLAEVDSDGLRSLFLSKATSQYDPGMNADLRRLLAKVDPADGSCPLLLMRLSEWFDEAERNPGRQRSDETPAAYRARLQAALAYWRSELGG